MQLLPPRSTLSSSSAASDVYKRQINAEYMGKYNLFLIFYKNNKNQKKAMKNSGGQGKGGGKFVKQLDAVADDRNWVGRIQNELNCVAQWQTDWGFLAGGADNLTMEKATQKYNIVDQIKLIEKEIDSLPQNDFDTGNAAYGQGKNLELYTNPNIPPVKFKEALKPQDRRLPKGWKKPKWKVEDDPNDPINQLFKKKK
eukprot:TRINITY_DN8286_c0_g1_i2.p1 TRINITY_DN8286_c0_g1~~TRINITY_DN8286_c0_g1_i2.p1  ORF type:complete len:198 (-),score=59.50 TRINITY_DN8286_c0_g1_i2:172-765(-)